MYSKLKLVIASIVIMLAVPTVFPIAGLRAQVDTAGIKHREEPLPLEQQVDVADMFRKIFKKKPKPPDSAKTTSITILPAIGYNPSFGFVLGAQVAGGKQLGKKENTIYSIFNLYATVTSKGIITLRARHNVFLPKNMWNLQGDWQISRMGEVDYGLGTGHGFAGDGFYWNELPINNVDSSFPIRYGYIRIFEKAYRKIGPKIYAGLGINFEIMSNIQDKKLEQGLPTPHLIYSKLNGFDSTHYSANGILLAFQYNSREHPLRSHGGIYFDFNLYFNPTFLGSTQNSTRLFYDFRKYWSLSRKNPEHVIALWQWSSFALSGKTPYLLFPGTAHDTYQRSGRGYTYGRFKGPSYSVIETEYRFPISKNKFISGAAFVNFQSASDGLDRDLFEYWEPGGGIGIRVLFNKKSRTNLCGDFARGRYGSNGIFFGLNEVF